MPDPGNCLFCRIARGEIPSHRVHESEHAIAFLDIRPIRKGHVLVVPREHFAYYDDLPPEIAADIMRIAQRLAPALRSSMGVERVALFFTGVDIAHAHAHVVPMVEPTDLTSPCYIAERPLTFAPAPQSPTEELQGTAQAIRGALGPA